MVLLMADIANSVLWMGVDRIWNVHNGLKQLMVEHTLEWINSKHLANEDMNSSCSLFSKPFFALAHIRLDGVNLN